MWRHILFLTELLKHLIYVTQTDLYLADLYRTDLYLPATAEVAFIFVYLFRLALFLSVSSSLCQELLLHVTPLA